MWCLFRFWKCLAARCHSEKLFVPPLVWSKSTHVDACDRSDSARAMGAGTLRGSGSLYTCIFANCAARREAEVRPRASWICKNLARTSSARESLSCAGKWRNMLEGVGVYTGVTPADNVANGRSKGLGKLRDSKVTPSTRRRTYNHLFRAAWSLQKQKISPASSKRHEKTNNSYWPGCRVTTRCPTGILAIFLSKGPPGNDCMWMVSALRWTLANASTLLAPVRAKRSNTIPRASWCAGQDLMPLCLHSSVLAETGGSLVSAQTASPMRQCGSLQPLCRPCAMYAVQLGCAGLKYILFWLRAKALCARMPRRDPNSRLCRKCCLFLFIYFLTLGVFLKE